MPSFPFLSDAAKELVSEEAFRDYGETGGVANQSSFGKLSELGSADLFDASINDASMAECCLSGLCLLHNFLDGSHTITQDIASPEGSYWHGIMHRMEGDFGNSKYGAAKLGLIRFSKYSISKHPTDGATTILSMRARMPRLRQRPTPLSTIWPLPNGLLYSHTVERVRCHES